MKFFNKKDDTVSVIHSMVAQAVIIVVGNLGIAILMLLK